MEYRSSLTVYNVYKKSIFFLWIVFDIIRFIVNIKKFTGTKYLQIMAVISQIYIDLIQVLLLLLNLEVAYDNW